jgi:succinate dehydrogenase flavin-adding protein (antitoxin of CptAB toxin-antitoxin module)
LGAWYARNYAARIWQMLEKMSAKEFDPFKADFDKSDLDLYKEIVAEQKRQAERGKRG